VLLEAGLACARQGEGRRGDRSSCGLAQTKNEVSNPARTCLTSTVEVTEPMGLRDVRVSWPSNRPQEVRGTRFVARVAGGASRRRSERTRPFTVDPSKGPPLRRRLQEAHDSPEFRGTSRSCGRRCVRARARRRADGRRDAQGDLTVMFVLDSPSLVSAGFAHDDAAPKRSSVRRACLVR
jgi:hypothetical protein